MKDVDKDLVTSFRCSCPQATTRLTTRASECLYRTCSRWYTEEYTQDKNDESLQSYKKTLLGDIKEEELKEDEAAEVEILKIEVVCEGRPKGNIILDFSGQHLGKNVHKFVIR